MNVQHVPLEWVNFIWPKVEPFISAALAHACGEYDVKHAEAYVTSGKWVLLIAVNPDDGAIGGAATVELFNRPTARVALITAIGGRGVVNAQAFVQMRALLASFGATTIEGMARPAAARLWRRFGFVNKYQVIEAKL